MNYVWNLMSKLARSTLTLLGRIRVNVMCFFLLRAILLRTVLYCLKKYCFNSITSCHPDSFCTTHKRGLNEEVGCYLDET